MENRKVVRRGPRLRVDPAAGPKRAFPGLCAECALRHHDFHELIGNDSANDGFSDFFLPRAFIDGRLYMLLPSSCSRQKECGECRGKVPNLYLPVT